MGCTIVGRVDDPRKYYDLTRDGIERLADFELKEAEHVIFVQCCRIEKAIETSLTSDANTNKMGSVTALGYRKYDLALVHMEMKRRKIAPIEIHPTLMLNLEALTAEVIVEMEKARSERASIGARHALATEFLKQAERMLTDEDFKMVMTEAMKKHQASVQTGLQGQR